jgi:hypothetical protein
MEWGPGPVIGIDGFCTAIDPNDVDMVVAALLEAKEQCAPEPATSDGNISAEDRG